MAATALAEVVGSNVDVKLLEAKVAALKAIRPDIERLSARMIEQKARDKLLSQAPCWRTIQKLAKIDINLDIPALFAEEVARFNKLIDDSDLAGIISRYPIRQTGLIDQIVIKLGFTDRNQYESAVRKMVMNDKDVKALMLSFFGSLPSDIAAA